MHFSMLSDSLDPKRCHVPKRDRGVSFLIFSSPSLWRGLISLSLWSCLSGTCPIRKIPQGAPSSVWLLSPSVMCSRCRQCEKAALFPGCIIFHCVDALCLSVHPSTDGHRGCCGQRFCPSPQPSRHEEQGTHSLSGQSGNSGDTPQLLAWLQPSPHSRPDRAALSLRGPRGVVAGESPHVSLLL